MNVAEKKKPILETLTEEYYAVRKHTEAICTPLIKEDYVVQPMADVSPPKWHLGHTSWFFETMVLKEHLHGYKEFHPQYNFVFNSYYESVGARVIRTHRGNLSRPDVDDIYRYRKHVDEAMMHLLEKDINTQLRRIIEIGIQHEQQHQELLLADIKYILGNNPLLPPYRENYREDILSEAEGYTAIDEGLYEIGFRQDGFCFDNELQPHKVYLPTFKISNGGIKNGEYLEFIKAGGYEDFRLWHSEGWDWVNQNKITAPLYWHRIEGKWHEYTLAGLQPLDENCLLAHVSYYEAYAFARWKQQRLPTEFEWEAAAKHFNWGDRWEWTESSYLPYPGFSIAPGALGEYNGKFMVSQKVLRGASVATSPGHSRATYRNFFYPQQRWQFTGIRLAK